MIDEVWTAGGPGLGGFQIRLEDCPVDVRRQIRFDDHLVVTPGWMDPDVVGAAGIVSAAYYRGRILDLGPQKETIGGHGLVGWLGDSYDIGEWLFSYTVSARTMLQHLALLAAAGPPDALGGFTRQGVGTLPTGTWPASTDDPSDLPAFVPARLAFLAGALDVEWDITPVGVLRYTSAGDPAIYMQTPRVLLAPGVEGRDIDLRGLDADVELAGDWQDRPAHGWTQWGFFGSAYAGSPNNVRWRFDGGAIGSANPPAEHMNWGAIVDTQADIESVADATAAVQADLRRRRGRNTVRITVRDRDPRRFVRPGDWVYAQHDAQGLHDADQRVWWKGRHWTPARLRVHAMSWPLLPRHGVFILDRSDPMAGIPLCLTRWAVPDNADATLEVGALARTAFN